MLNLVNNYKMMTIERYKYRMLTGSLQESLSLEILVGLLVDNISLAGDGNGINLLLLFKVKMTGVNDEVLSIGRALYPQVVTNVFNPSFCFY